MKEEPLTWMPLDPGMEHAEAVRAVRDRVWADVQASAHFDQRLQSPTYRERLSAWWAQWRRA